MLVMYRRIYKEALRQKEAIRRSSVPSQQHLIVDSDSVRSRFQTLQANGFRSSNNLKIKGPPMAVTNQHSIPVAVSAAPTPPKPAAPPIIMTSSESNEGLTKIDEVETKFDSNTNGTSANEATEVKPVVSPPTAPPGTPSQATPPAFPGPTPPPASAASSTTQKKDTAPSSTSSPVRNVLTPTANLLGTVQRRLSFANTNIAEGRLALKL